MSTWIDNRKIVELLKDLVSARAPHNVKNIKASIAWIVSALGASLSSYFSGNTVSTLRAQPSYRPMPVLYDEDDHYGFDKQENNFKSAISVYAGWGYFDNGGQKDKQSHKNPEVGNYIDGYQNVPVNWGLNSPS